jgi:SAM-dependent methyltransferase
LKRSSETTVQLSFAVTIFVGATLLFACQPMIARMIVPFLGGAAAVWIVCSLCFQTLLLAGYAYAHFVGTRLAVRSQIMLQLALVGSVFLVMPIAVDEAVATRLTSGHPTLGLLVLLLRTIGLPFFVLSTSSPLLQRWFAELGERDPYHLYAASNAGSMVALIGYPLAVEPLLAVRGQSRALHAVFAVYAVLVVACAAGTLRRPSPSRIETTPAPPQVRISASQLPVAEDVEQEGRRWSERITWIVLAFAPSSLLLGATVYATTDIASVPLLWVVPLALYLLSFIVAFAKKQVVRPKLVSRATAVAAALVGALTLAQVSKPTGLVLGAHMLLLFLASVVCHRGLAERRPHVSRLTEFYLLLSIGGVLGGVFNGLLAPLVFDELYEYPVAIGLACLGRVVVEGGRPRGLAARALAVDLGLGLGLAAVAYVAQRLFGERFESGGAVWVLALPALVALLWSTRPLRFAAAVGTLCLVGMSQGGRLGTTIWADRGFFGALKVVRQPRFLVLVSGKALDGEQARDPEEAKVPLAFYFPTGPAGDVLGPLPRPDVDLPPRRVGVVGLGVGSLAAYARKGDDWTFFEINPVVVDVARDQFTYLKRAEESARVHLEVGDARLRLRQGAAARFDVLVLDAFSSDALPTHLVTREALAVYRRALAPGGVILAHVSNEHIELGPVFRALARDAHMSIIGRRDASPSPEDVAQGKAPSEWVLLTDSRAEVDRILRTTKDWRPLSADGPPRQSVWTDDYANVLGALRF